MSVDEHLASMLNDSVHFSLPPIKLVFLVLLIFEKNYPSFYFISFEKFFFSKMKYVSAYMLAQIGGKKAPTHDDIHKILGNFSLISPFLVKRGRIFK